jgi:hypothetical protein
LLFARFASLPWIHLPNNNSASQPTGRDGLVYNVLGQLGYLGFCSINHLLLAEVAYLPSCSIKPCSLLPTGVQSALKPVLFYYRKYTKFMELTMLTSSVQSAIPIRPRIVPHVLCQHTRNPPVLRKASPMSSIPCSSAKCPSRPPPLPTHNSSTSSLTSRTSCCG